MRLFIYLLMSFSIVAVANEQEGQVGEMAYSGEMTPAQIVSSWYHNEAPSREGLLEVKFSTAVIQDGEIVAQDTAGLPGLYSDAGGVADDAKITVPFEYFLNESEANQEGFVRFIDNMENVLQKVSIGETDRPWENMRHCAGFPVGSRLSVTWVSGFPLCTKIVTHYECMTVNGANDWYIYDQDVKVIPGCLMIP